MASTMADRMERETKKILALKEKASEHLKMYPYELESIENVRAKVSEKDGLQKFFDIDFSPELHSIISPEDENPFQKGLQWRRVDEFMYAVPSKNLGHPMVFSDNIEPNDIKQGALGNCWFMCALASLAERPKLVENLFITQEKNKEGVYRIKFCKNGNWEEVTVDDYFPCYPFSGPIFSRAHGNEMWVLLLEKAYAKLHGNYWTLRGGFANEGMIDLTGCPSTNYDFTKPSVIKMIQNGDLFNEMIRFDEQGYLLSASTPGEDRWTGKNAEVPAGGLVPGHAYSVIQVKEALGNRLVNIRNPWGRFEWDGDWHDNDTVHWTDEMIALIQPKLDDQDGTFWMSFENFVEKFRGLNVCRVRNWQENRVRGKFLRLTDDQDPSFEQVVSKWYYEFDIDTEQEVFIGIHQEDERIHGVIDLRPFIDIGVTLIKVNEDESFDLVNYLHLVKDRQAELETKLVPGKYIALPRTTGGLMKNKPRKYDQKPPSPFLQEDGQSLTCIFNRVVEDIFRKFDVVMSLELNYNEFKYLYQMADPRPDNLSPEDFREHFLNKYCSTSEGITMRGLKDFFKDVIIQQGEDLMRQWLSNLGYDEHFFNVESRAFNVTFHSTEPIEVTLKDAVKTDLDSWANAAICLRDLEVKGSQRDFQTRQNIYKLIYSANPESDSYCYSIINLSGVEHTYVIDYSQSEDTIGIPSSGSVTRTVQPGDCSYLFSIIANPDAEQYTRKIKVSVR